VCGLCGVVGTGDLRLDDRAAVREMTDALAHRGPDGRGDWSDGRAALGHRRLVVIDPAGGAQPMRDEPSGVVLVYNGEVYNYRELRRLLTARGHRLRTAGDTEVVLRGYLEWGPAVAERLRGMFAFAVWDPRRARLLLARDRLGVKPLYLAEAGDGRLAFASEAKALLAHPAVPRALNAPRVAEQIAFRTVAGEETLFRGIRELAPASVAVWEGGRLTRSVYWTPRVPPAPAGPDPAAEGRRLLGDAVASRLVSDVPLGTINSGGLDSSLLSALAAERLPEGIDSFCVGLADPEWDERPYARRVARRIGSRHHEAELTGERVATDLDVLTWANDEPLHVASSVGLCLVYRHARERAGVTVLLSGEGADEVFGGYRWYGVASRRIGLRRLPGLARLARRAPMIGRAGRLRRLMGRDVMLGANAFVPPERAVRLSGDPAADPLAPRRQLWPAGPAHEDDLFAYDQRTYLQLALQRQDRMSMAAGVEAREPFLDHHLVEWANGLAPRVRLAGGVAKALLKEMARPWLPADIVHRPKNGFGVPFGEWMRPGGPLSERVHALTDAGAPIAAMTEPAEVRRLVDEHAAGRADHRSALWSLLALDTWARVFLGPAVRAAVLPGARAPARR
jgi:asparagine synthase (glutamine-hydrolysing)